MESQEAPKLLPTFFVGKGIANERTNNYLTRKHPLLTQELKKEDTCSIWYSREHIVKLLEEIDHAKGSGLRIHLGAYEKGHEFEGQLCLVMNSTRAKDVGGVTSHVNVHLEDEPDFAERSQLARSAFDPSKVRDFNFGSPCPPRCNG